MNINTNTTKRIWNTISQDNRMDQQYINGKNSEDIIILIFRNDLGLKTHISVCSLRYSFS